MFDVISSAYEVEVDNISPTQWAAMMGDFQDASIYQSWGYGEGLWGRGRLSHLTLRREGRMVAMAQLVVMRAPIVGGGIAQLRWGPMCHRIDSGVDATSARAVAKALREEYVRKRRLCLRVYPRSIRGTDRERVLDEAFRDFSIVPFTAGESYRTILVELGPSLETIRRSLEQKWRNQLNRAERNGLVVRHGNSSKEFEVFARLYEQMRLRKQLSGSSSVNDFAHVQTLLQSTQQMNVLICENEGRPVAGLVATSIGSTGVYLLGATNEEGMATKAAYLLQWREIEFLKASGLTSYDLGGINPDTNPGVYHFKKGLGGRDVEYMQPRVACDSTKSRVFTWAASVARRRTRIRLGRRSRRQLPHP